MTPIKDVCRLLLTTSLSNRRIASALRMAPNTAQRYRTRLAEEGLDWSDVCGLDEETLSRRLNTGRRQLLNHFVEPDWSHVHKELQRRGVTVTLLHEEYAGSLVAGVMSETEFRRRLHRYQRTRGLVMRQVHRPGECLFLDFSGMRPSLTHPATGQRTPVELFVAVFGASRKTFVYAVASQTLPDWIDANVKALEFFGGVPMFLVPDNLKSAVISHKRGEGALLNKTYSECAAHYGTTILPARPHTPKDKAHVELGVKIAQRWILARLRHRTFTSLAELNVAISEQLDRMNDRPMRSCGGKSRNQLFDELNRPALSPFPVEPYTFGEWQLGVRVGQDYHVRWDEQYYSVPYTLVSAKVNLKATRTAILVFHRDRRVALHPRHHESGYVSTLPEHQPRAHRAYANDQPAAVMAWAQAAGGAIHRFLQQHIEHHRRPAQSLQAGRGLQRMAREYGSDRLQAACDKALRLHAFSIRSVKSMLQRGIDHALSDTQDAANDTPTTAHDNVRGANYYPS